VYNFKKTVIPKLHGFKGPEVTSAEASEARLSIQQYHEEMCQRSWLAVLASRQATLDAHDWSRITTASPLVAKRAMYLDGLFDQKTGLLKA
jgi:hypothetical protein